MLVKKERIPVLHMLLIGIWPSFIKKIIYRIKGYKIGKNVKLSFGSVVLGKEVEIGDHTAIGFFTIIRGRRITIKRYVKIGSMSVIDTEQIYIDDDARINEQVYIGGMKTPESSFHMGKRTIIMQMSYINPTLPVFIDDDSGIGGHCLFFTHGSWNSLLEGYPVKFAPIRLGKKVWLPWRVFVMPGVEIGDGSVIGANSLVTSSIPANTLAAGNPAKILKEKFPDVPAEEKKITYTLSILHDFEKYLSYHGFTVQNNVNESGHILVSGKNKKAVVIYNETNFKPGTDDHVLILHNADATLLRELRSRFLMVLSLSHNIRSGTTDSGEELVQFFSRYGVRFERMD